MIEEETLLLFLVLLVGVTVILAILIKAALERIGIEFSDYSVDCGSFG